MQGSSQVGGTTLAEALALNETSTITVASTEGFPNTGIIVIDDEKIAYPSKTSTTFISAVAQPMIRGAEETTPAAHAVNSSVRTIEGSMINTAISYNISVIGDASGLWAGLNIGLALLRMIGSFLLLPISFLGTDLQILGVIWGVISAGLVMSIGLSLAGARRVG